MFYKNLKKDIELKEILQKLIKIDKKSRIEINKKHLEKILKSIKENELYSVEAKKIYFQTIVD